jgi:hypothetical protein
MVGVTGFEPATSHVPNVIDNKNIRLRFSSLDSGIGENRASKVASHAIND